LAAAELFDDGLAFAMAIVRIFKEDWALHAPGEIRDFLRPFGIDYDCWPVAGRVDRDASAAEILQAYAPEVETLKARGGYITADVVDVTPEVPNLQAMLDKFNKEHRHAEDEVRFVVKGRGIFYVHPENNASPLFSIQVEEGDLINVPAGTKHWFDLCADRTIRAIRLFREKAGWTPLYTGDGIASQFEPLCFGPSYLPGGGSAVEKLAPLPLLRELRSFSAGGQTARPAPSQAIQFGGALILLDIEGTVSPLAYVHDVLFPYARTQLVSFLERRRTEPEVLAAVEAMFAEARPDAPVSSASRMTSDIAALANELMDQDAKQTGLKQLQGLIWEEGFASGALKSVVFPDVAPALAAWVAAGRKAHIFSSGSIHAQRLFFRHTAAGDLSGNVTGHHDTTTGPKRAPASYAAIAAQAGVTPGEMLYVSDVVAELDAARAAGCATALALRPGNAPNPPHPHPVLHSFDEIEIA